MQKRGLVVLALLAGALFALLPLEGGARAATGAGADGDVAFVNGSNILTKSNPSSALVSNAQDPSWSPNGTKLAFTTVPGGSIETCTVTSCGTTTSAAVDTGSTPVWSPDGSTLAYVKSGDVYTIGATATGGTGATQLTTTGGTNPTWSPTATGKIAFANAGKIFTIDTTTPGAGTQLPISGTFTAGTLDQPAWSPDGSTIAFQASDPATGHVQIWVVPYNGGTGGTATRATTDVVVNGDKTAPNWAPGSDAIVFAVSSAGAGNGIYTTTGSGVSWGPPNSDHLGSDATPDQGTSVPGTGVAPTNTVYPVINIPAASNGTPNIGDFLSVSNGSWAGSFPMTFTYQWKKCTSPTGPCFNIIGATRSTFSVTTDLYGMSLRAEVTAKNSAGSLAQNSEATKLVSAIKPFLRSTPQIVGTAQVAQTLSLTSGTWDGSTPLTFTYSWRRCDPVGTLTTCVQVPGGTSATYIPVVADIGFSLRVWITGTNPAGSDVAVTNHTFPVIDRVHFAPTTADTPLIVGTLEVGGLLSASVPTFSGDTPIATKQQWQRCDATGGACHNIANQTKLTYIPVEGDIGSTLRLVVTATNLYGTATPMSQVTDPVIAQLPHIKGKKINGNNKSNYLIGTAHDDTINGNGGNDTINGNGGYDTINGGSGNDVINVSGPGRSKVNGGSGSDTIYAANNEKDNIDCGSGQDRAVIDSLDVVHNCEVVEVGGNGNSSGNGVIHRRGKTSVASPSRSDARTRRAAARARSRAR